MVPEEYIAAVLSHGVSKREASGAATGIEAAWFPAHEGLEEFDFDHQPSADRHLIDHLGTGVFLPEAEDEILPGLSGTGKSQLEVGIGIKAAKAGHRLPFNSATDWIARLQEAYSPPETSPGTARLRRYMFLIIDELGYVRSFHPQGDLDPYLALTLRRPHARSWRPRLS